MVTTLQVTEPVTPKGSGKEDGGVSNGAVDGGLTKSGLVNGEVSHNGLLNTLMYDVIKNIVNRGEVEVDYDASSAQPIKLDCDSSNGSSGSSGGNPGTNGQYEYSSSGSNSSSGDDNDHNQTVINCYERVHKDTPVVDPAVDGVVVVDSVVDDPEVMVIDDDSVEEAPKVESSPIGGSKNKTITNFFKIIPSEKKNKAK